MNKKLANHLGDHSVDLDLKINTLPNINAKLKKIHFSNNSKI